MTAAVHIDRDADATPADEAFELWVSAVFDHTPAPTPSEISPELSIRCVELDEMTEANSRFRQKTGATNVLSFPVDPDLIQKTGLLGDILICAPVVTAEAERQGKDVSHHWAHLTVHGTLHLLGFDHIEDDQAKQMEALEIAILNSLTIPNPYA
jgi:probable rRNA maturation factor